jgi:ABC-type transporter Mla subunit MlaD
MRDDSSDEPNAPADEPTDPAVRSATPGLPADQDAATEDLRATGDSIRSDIRRLAGVEEVKRGLDADDPEVDRLSDEAVNLATRIARQTKAERQLSDEIG